MRTLSLRTAVALLGILVAASSASAVVEISCFFDHGAKQISSVPDSFRPRSDAFPAELGMRPRQDVRYVFYTVFGQSFVEIMKSVEENGIREPGSEVRRPSSSDWVSGLTFVYDYVYDIDEEQNTVFVSVDVLEVRQNNAFRMTLPALVNDTGLNPIEQSMFREFLSKLLEQENRRLALVQDTDAWNELKKAIEGLQLFRFDYVEGMDIERTAEMVIKDDVIRFGRERAVSIREKVQAFDRKNAAQPGRPQATPQRP